MITCRFCALVSLAAVGCLAGHRAEASGFGLREQGAVLQGLANAGASAGSGALSSMYYNPAALGLADEPGVDSGVSYIIPRIKLKDSSASTAFGVPITGSSTDRDAGPDAIVPTLYGALPLDDQWTVGLAVTVPFGLGTDYAANWVGRYHGLETSIASINVAPTLSWRPVSWLTLGGSVAGQYVHTKLSNAIDFGTAGQLVEAKTGTALPIDPAPGQQDGRAIVDGDDIAFGFTLGMLAEPWEGTRIGLAYRSEIDHEIKGDATFNLGSSGMGALVAGATGQFVNTGARAGLTTPANASIGITQDLGERFQLMGEIQWTGWSSFDELVIKFDNPSQASSVTAENWDDTWFFSAGGAYRLTDSWTLRAGAAYEQSPVPDADRTPRVPDADRIWLSAGASWQAGPAWTFDIGYSHVFVENADVDLTASGTGNSGRGNLSAAYENSIDVIAIQARFRF